MGEVRKVWNGKMERGESWDGNVRGREGNSGAACGRGEKGQKRIKTREKI